MDENKPISQYFFVNALLISIACICAPASAAPLSGEEIAKRAYDIPRVDDQVSTLTMTFKKGSNEKRLVYKMAWQDTHGKRGYQERVLLFGQFPPDQLGIAYMSYRRGPNAQKEDDTWLYLPELRTVRRISQRDHKHAHDDVFGNSVLKLAHLDPRDPRIDDHKLLRTERLDGREHYVIESTPLVEDTATPFLKTQRWIDSENYLTRRIEFFGLSGQRQIVMQILWRPVDQTWIWEKVFGENTLTGNKTIFTITDIEVNRGLNNKIFSKRTMTLGPRALR